MSLFRYSAHGFLVATLVWLSYPYLDSAIDVSDPAARPADGQLVTTVPEWTPLKGNSGTYDITGRVLSRKKYPTDGRRLDIVVGWGPMSDNRVLDRLTIRQFERTHEVVLAPGVPITVDEAYATSMNITLRSDGRSHRNADLRSIRVGDIVRVIGWAARAVDARRSETTCGTGIPGRRCAQLTVLNLQINDRKVFGYWSKEQMKEHSTSASESAGP